MQEKLKGRVTKLSGGFYFVETKQGTFMCRARGKFRKDNFSPMVGDIAVIETTGESEGFLLSVSERRNFLIRPAVANIDLLLVIISVKEPYPNLGVTDRLLAVAAHKGIECAIIVTKADLDEKSAEKIGGIYKAAGYKTLVTGNGKRDRKEIAELIRGRLCVFAGNTGSGKSTLLNFLDENLERETGEISQKLGRGRHTTRTVEIFPVAGGFMADTPGFSSLETLKLEKIKKDELEDCFIEFEPFLGKCQFTGCAHVKEKGCAVLKAVEEGKISKERHSSYCMMYEEAKEIKDWE